MFSSIKSRVAAIAGVLLLGAGAVLTPQLIRSGVDPVSCTGYLEPRVGVEIQAWWRDRTGEAFPGRHVHVFVCWPTGVVTGIVGLDMKVQTHGQPAGTFVKRLRATDGSGVNAFPAMTSGFTPIVGGAMTQWVHKDINTANLSSGLREIRLAAYVDQGDFDQFVSSGLPLFVRTMSGGSTSRDRVESRGWYPVFLYDNARYEKRLSDFLTVKSGIWNPTVGCASPSGETGDLFTVNLNPSFHSLNSGIQVLSYAGEATRTLNIDTRTLPNGINKIVIGCEASANLSGHDGFNRGVLAIDFKVGN